MKFIADAMLGRLATWMRILGCDVAYEREIQDRELVERALGEDRMLLTKDTLLAKRRRARDRCFLVAGDDYRDQLRQVVRRFGIDFGSELFTRCLRCNELLESIENESVREHVPPYVYSTQSSFEHCPSCRRIYWRATHRDRMTVHLREIMAGDDI